MSGKKPFTKVGVEGTRAAKDTPFLSVVIPCFNEENIIDDTLRKVVGYLEAAKYPYEIIAVDDGSRDSTAAKIMSWAEKSPSLRLLENQKNRGKGFSVSRGLLEARGRYVCFTDADLSTPIEEIEKLLHWLKDFEVVIGSRSIKGSSVEVHQPMWRELMGKTFNLFVRLIAFPGIKDTQCGFKGFRNESAKEIFSRRRIDGFGFDVEALYIAKKLGYGIKEVPIKWINRFESKVNPFTHPVQMIRDILKIRIWDLKGAYK